MFVVGLQSQPSIWLQDMNPFQKRDFITRLFDALHGNVVELAQLF